MERSVTAWSRLARLCLTRSFYTQVAALCSSASRCVSLRASLRLFRKGLCSLYHIEGGVLISLQYRPELAVRPAEPRECDMPTQSVLQRVRVLRSHERLLCNYGASGSLIWQSRVMLNTMSQGANPWSVTVAQMSSSCHSL